MNLITAIVRWEWAGDWEVDHSKRYGECDAEGFMYGSSNDKLLESIRNKQTVGTTSSTSLVRRRCYIRPKICTSEAAREEHKKSIESYAATKSKLELSMKDKRQEMNAIVSFESSRVSNYETAVSKSSRLEELSIQTLHSIVQRLQLLRQVSAHGERTTRVTVAPVDSS